MKLKNSMKPLKKVVTPARPTSSTIPLLQKLMRLMGWCAISNVSVRNGEVVSSVMQKLYSWGVFLFLVISSVLLFLTVAPPANNSESIPIQSICLLCVTLLCHLSVAGALYYITLEHMTTYIELLKRVDEKAGLVESLDPGCKIAVVFLMLHILGVLTDVCLSFFEGIPQISPGTALVANTVVFVKYIMLEIVFVFLSLLPTIRMRAIQIRVVEITKMLDVETVEEYWITATDPSNHDIYYINKDVSRLDVLESLFLYIDLQESTRSAARIVEDCLGLSVLSVVIICFIAVFFNLLFGIWSIVNADRFLTAITAGRFFTYFFMFCSLSETCHSFYFADMRVTRALHDASSAYTHCTRGSVDPRALQLWTRLRAASTRHPKYTAFRLLDINRDLVCSVLQTALTYSIMLLQLKSGLQVDKVTL